MKISVNWLRRYVDFDWSTEELAQRLTLSGSEVEEITRIRPSFTNVRIGHVEAVEQHPNADKLRLATVRLGEDEVEKVVCGAANCRAGLKVAYAGLGAVLYPGLPKEDGEPIKPLKIKKAKIRGVVSLGMLCSEEELGLADSAPGISELGEDAPIGAPLEEYWPISDDVLDIGVTANRGDCLSHLGIAREVAALAGVEVKYPAIELPKLVEGEAIPVDIRDADRCGRYIGRVIKGLEVAPSPVWMQRLLTAVGVRPINNLVDVTNFVLFEYGQPLHAFDLKDVSGPAIVVRTAKDGEVVTTLDGEDRELTSEDLLICDAERPVALAGVMGGLNSEVKGDTTDVLLESAYFQPTTVRMTARRAKLSSESSRRFERGVDPARTLEAANRALSLFAQLSEGEAVVVEAFTDAHPKPVERPIIAFSPAETNKRLGVEWADDPQREALTRLGFEVSADWQVKVPSWRSDVDEGADLVEEIARHTGYDKIPTPAARITTSENKGHRKEARRRLIRSYLGGLGINQALNFSFLAPEAQALFTDEPTLDLLNPLTEDHRALRRTLVTSLVNSASHNQRHADLNVRLFEIGRVFHPNAEGELPVERERLGVLLSGEATRHWSGRREYDFFDLKGAVEGLMEALDLEATFAPVEGVKWLHPGVAAEVKVDGEVVGLIGELHPKIHRKLKLKKPLLLAELEIAPLLAEPSTIQFEDFTKFPASTRDIALVVPKSITAAQVLTAIEDLSISVIDKLEIFDVYEGGDLAPTERSLGVSVRYRDAHETLTEAKVTKAHERVVEHLKVTFNVDLRA